MSLGNVYSITLQFTFHHVSIKTTFTHFSTPFLYEFTFHHVSIKTCNLALTESVADEFTFHHVSIKTAHPPRTLQR